MYGTPDLFTIRSLRTNVAAFSAAKSMVELIEFNQLLVNERDNIRSFSEFKRLATVINEKYNIHYLSAEYQTAVASAQMASKWNDFQQNDVVPNITIVTAGDERVRESHAGYDGFTRPKNDPIWNSFWPPFDWNCRCTGMETEGIELSRNEFANLDTIKPMFRNNSGASGITFTGDHPYFDVSGNVSSLDYAKAYGLPSALELMAKASAIDKPTDVDRYWKQLAGDQEFIMRRDRVSASVKLSRSVLEDATRPQAALRALSEPDEVWVTRSGIVQSIKYHRELTAVTSVNLSGDVISYAELSAQEVNSIRKGIIIHGR